MQNLMKLNWIERLFVNSPIRLAMQFLEVNWLCKKRPLSAGCSILEIGCGRGTGAGFIIEKFKPGQLFLSDLDPKMIMKARAYLVDKGQSNIRFCLSDAAHLPFGDQKFDAVFGFGFLHHVPKWRDSLAEVVRVLKKNGAYYLVEFYPAFYQNVITKRLLAHPEYDRFQSPDLRDAFKNVNLALTDAFELKNMGIIGIGIKN